MLKKKRQAKERQKELLKLTEIADAFIKARGVYPPDYDGFLEVAGEKQVGLFCQTMYLVAVSADKIGYRFRYNYDQRTKEWSFEFVDELA